jgi:tetratricopeptide (TPR) repeat protein
LVGRRHYTWRAVQTPNDPPPRNVSRFFTARRVAGLVALAALVSWPLLRSCSPEVPEPVIPAPPVREEFHASKPLRLELKAEADETDLRWLRYELNHLLTRGKMHMAAVSIDPDSEPEVFTLRVTVSADGKQAALALIAPDNVIDQQSTWPLPAGSRLATMSAFATALPRFLNAAHTTSDWVALLGTDDAKAYDTFLNSSLEWLGPQGLGFTQPAASPRRSPTVEQLETLVRNHPKFARAWGSLATGYLSLGGEDETSLTQLAESNAEHALTLDEGLADAHAALGLVHLRRSEWVAAREQFERALTLDAQTIAALEGLACLLVDAGRFQEAAPFAAQAAALQPDNRGARECFAYTLTESKQESAIATAPSQVQALEAILAGDNAAAKDLLRNAVSPQDFARWADPLLRAAENRRDIPQALQAVTLAASERQIDPSTEILCGTALKQPEFVFNRMSRLQRQGERLPLRVLWMPQTKFLRQHPRFEQIVSGAGLPAFWQEQGIADVCAAEPALYGCKMHPATGRAKP